MAGGVYHPIVPITLVVGDRTLTTYAMLHSAATRSAIVPSLVSRLRLPVRTELTTITAFDRKTTSEHKLVSYTVESFDQTTVIHIRDALVSDTITTENERPPSYEDVEGLDYMEGVVSFHELEDDLIGVVLSARHAWTWTGGETVSGHPDQPVAQLTRFGWTLIGHCQDEGTDEAAVNCCMVENEHLPL